MGPTPPTPGEFEFTLLLTGVADLTPAVTDALFEAGCDDATVGVRAGRAFAAFTRPAAALRDAVLSAVRDVRRAGFDVRSVEPESSPDVAVINAALEWQYQRRHHPELADETLQNLSSTHA